MVAFARVGIIEDGIQPKRSNAEVLELWQVILNALEIAAVVGLGGIAIIGS